MKENIENFLKSFFASFQIAQMYGCQHPEFDKVISKTYQELKLILAGQKELAIAVIGNELTSGDDIFFDLSKKLTVLTNKLISKGCEKLIFKENIKKRELKELFLFFLIPKDKIADPGNYFQSKSITNIRFGKIKESSPWVEKGPKEPQPRHFSRQLYLDSVSTFSESFFSVVQDQKVDFSKFSIIINNLAKGADYHYQEILRISKLKGKDIISFAHLLNVSFLSMQFSKYLGFNGSACREIGLASLLHDIGKLYISNKILKGGKLSAGEFKQIKSHSLLGAKILLASVDKIGELPLVVSLEHHLKLDLEGYPKLKFPRPLHRVSMLVSLCDVYDALSQRRSYKSSFPPEQIYAIMKEGRGSQFHPGLFDSFFEFIGVWPNGTVVLLSNDNVARVKGQNSGNIFSPKVEIVSDELHKTIDLKQDGLNLKIKKSLNPYKEGKKYLNTDRDI